MLTRRVMPNIERVAIIGAGNMGSGIAQKSSQENFEVEMSTSAHTSAPFDSLEPTAAVQNNAIIMSCTDLMIWGLQVVRPSGPLHISESKQFCFPGRLGTLRWQPT